MLSDFHLELPAEKFSALASHPEPIADTIKSISYFKKCKKICPTAITKIANLTYFFMNMIYPKRNMALRSESRAPIFHFYHGSGL
jgi:hypothetical protein